MTKFPFDRSRSCSKRSLEIVFSGAEYPDVTNETKSQSDQVNCPAGLDHGHSWEILDEVWGKESRWRIGGGGGGVYYIDLLLDNILMWCQLLPLFSSTQ